MEFMRLYLPDIVEWDEETYTESYGKLLVTPLERGFGPTLGNALRRVLLSSIEGAAPVAVRIEGAKHEFTTIPGVVQDVPEMILNIKGLSIHYDGDETGLLKASVKGPAKLKSTDLQTDDPITVAGDEQTIAEVGEDGELTLEIEVQKGKGYVTADEWWELRPSTDVGTILLDSWFGPVQKVNYNVESARVGDKTDYDKLTMEVATDASISPKEAVKKACEILVKHMELIITGRTRLDLEAEGGGELEEKKEFADVPLKETELSPRLVNCLTAGGIKSISDLLDKTESDLLSLRNFGQASLQKVVEMLSERDLSLLEEGEE